MSICTYFDTNPLLHWAELKSGAANDRAKAIGVGVEKLIADSGTDCAVSEITLAEFHTKLCSFLRDGARLECNQAWFDNVMQDFMGWISSSKLRVLPMPPKLVESAMSYVECATREHGRNVRAWDAMHIFHACEWARTVGTKVHVVTSDKDFKALLEIYPSFGEFVVLSDLANS